MNWNYIGTCLSTLLIGCASADTPNASGVSSTNIAVVVDVTDRKKLWPTADPILHLFHCDLYPDAACSFSVHIISDMTLTPSSAYHLADSRSMERENTDHDPQFRERNIVGFYTTMRHAFHELFQAYDATQSLKYSEVWIPICNVLEQLSQDTSDKKLLIIFSDLLEHDDFNSYDAAGNRSIQAIAERLNRMKSVPQDLHGIQVVVVYEPVSREDDKRFNTMFEAYKLLLERHGAQITVQANNDDYNF
jgi:hypothetical protein